MTLRSDEVKSFPRNLLDSLRRRPTFRRTIVNIGWLSLDRVLRLGLGLIVNVWVARYLGPTQFGTFNYATAIAGLFAAFASLGLDQVVIRDLVTAPDRKEEVLGTAFLLRLTAASLALVAASATAYFLCPTDTSTVTLVAITIAGALFQAFDVIDFWFQAQVQSKYTVYAKNAAFLAAALAKITLITIRAPLVAFAIVGLVEVLLASCGLLLYYQTQGAHFHSWRASWFRARRMLRAAWPLTLAGLAITVYMKIDQVMLGNMLGETEVGIYSAATRVSEGWYFLPTIISSSVFPALAALYHDSEERYYERLTQLMGYFFWATLLLGLTVSAFSPHIIRLLYGPAYARAAGVLCLHIYAGIPVSMGVIFGQKYVLDGTTKLSFYGTLVGAISNIVINLALIPRYGAYGAAIATLVSYAMPTVFLTAIFDRRIGLTFLRSVLFPFRATSAPPPPAPRGDNT